MRTFSLSCKADGAEAHIKELITSAVTCGVQNLSLFLPKATLPSSIFTCSTLEKLRVQSGYFLKQPSSMCLSKLQVLTLSGVAFEDSDGEVVCQSVT
ncbi:hypothetical protein CDL15_Pgr017700 [Punica granatum]|uniref:F-box/LRR-repeat protein 15/At3g58940/PEG3-like LRR domain-containing protein n=1 Tax=Punica granatum TaxID=22663 RepID=A0A218WX92_PUNGR|nr:hypothetical protein CDL15_Pgr017700 [Punica granatum]